MPRYQDTCQVTTYNSTIVDFGTPGCCAWTVPTGVCCLTFEIWGAGGGGGAKCCCECNRGGPGGAGGGYSKKTISTTPGSSYTICVGAGGMQPTVGNCTIHWCCWGQDGQTTYVTGTGLSGFCATGGAGGHMSCYYHCGCTNDPGIGYGGDVCACGSSGVILGQTAAVMCMAATGGAAPFTNTNMPFSSDACCPCMIGQFGKFPGGGGATVYANACCCCSQGGTGGNGLVRIHY